MFTNWRTWKYLILIFLSNCSLSYQLSGNGGSVHGTRSRNSSIPLRSVLANQHGQKDFQCDYCQPKECINMDEEEDSGDDKFTYCYVERDNENGFSDGQVCARTDSSLRRLVKSEQLSENELSDCQLSKRSPFVSICWCRIQLNGDDGSSPKSESQLTERNRIRFNSGRRGGLQVVRRLQSAEDTRSSGEPQLKTRIRLDSPTANSSSLQASLQIKAPVAKQSSQDLSTASKPIAQRPIIHAIPRRPSPVINFKSKIFESKFSILTGLLLFVLFYGFQ